MTEHEEFIARNYPQYPKPFIYMGGYILAWLLFGAAVLVVMTLSRQLLP